MESIPQPNVFTSEQQTPFEGSTNVPSEFTEPTFDVTQQSMLPVPNESLTTQAPPTSVYTDVAAPTVSYINSNAPTSPGINIPSPSVQNTVSFKLPSLSESNVNPPINLPQGSPSLNLPKLASLPGQLGSISLPKITGQASPSISLPKVQGYTPSITTLPHQGQGYPQNQGQGYPQGQVPQVPGHGSVIPSNISLPNTGSLHGQSSPSISLPKLSGISTSQINVNPTSGINLPAIKSSVPANIQYQSPQMTNAAPGQQVNIHQQTQHINPLNMLNTNMANLNVGPSQMTSQPSFMNKSPQTPPTGNIGQQIVVPVYNKGEKNKATTEALRNAYVLLCQQLGVPWQQKDGNAKNNNILFGAIEAKLQSSGWVIVANDGRNFVYALRQGGVPTPTPTFQNPVPQTVQTPFNAPQPGVPQFPGMSSVVNFPPPMQQVVPPVPYTPSSPLSQGEIVRIHTNDQNYQLDGLTTIDLDKNNLSLTTIGSFYYVEPLNRPGMTQPDNEFRKMISPTGQLFQSIVAQSPVAAIDALKVYISDNQGGTLGNSFHARKGPLMTNPIQNRNLIPNEPEIGFWFVDSKFQGKDAMGKYYYQMYVNILNDNPKFKELKDGVAQGKKYLLLEKGAVDVGPLTKDTVLSLINRGEVTGALLLGAILSGTLPEPSEVGLTN